MQEQSGAHRRRLRLAIVGCGRVVERFHLPSLNRSPAWEIVAFCDADHQRRTYMRLLYPDTIAAATLEDIASRVVLDACLIATPPTSHFSLACQALELGLHVLVEKPMALRVAEARTLCAMVKQQHKVLWVGFTRRFWEPYKRLRQHLTNVDHSLTHLCCTHLFDIRHWQPVTSHLGRDDSGSGVLDDVVSHQADLLAWLVGQPAVEVIDAQHRSVAEGASSLVYRLRLASGLVATCTAGHGASYAERIEAVIGNRRLVADPSGLWSTRLPAQLLSPVSEGRTFLQMALDKALRRRGPALQSFSQLWQDFAWALTHGSRQQTGATVHQGLYAVELVEACRYALQTGQSARIGVDYDY
jgi:UDP-N-acetylglucosamine 3-dehydrogenase